MTPSIWCTTSEPGFEWVVPVHDDDLQRLRDLRRPRSVQDWSPMPLERITDGDNTLPADMPWMASHVLVLKQKALDGIGRILEPWGDLLPLIGYGEPAALFTPDFLDVLDEEQSEIVRFKSSGRVMAVRRPVFKQELIPEGAIFRVPQWVPGKMFLSESVVEVIRSAGLHGTNFRRLDGGRIC